MFSDAIKVLEWSIKLVKNRETNNKSYFKDIVEPLFVEFEKVVGKYFELFSEDSIHDMYRIRDEYVQARVKVTELARLYRENTKDQDVQDFLWSIHAFFCDPKYSVGENYIDIVLERQLSNLEFDDVNKSVKAIQGNAWEKSVRLYGALKLKYQLPI